jgi:DNA processing protein
LDSIAEQRLAWLRLTLSADVPLAAQLAVVEAFGTPANAFASTHEDLAAVIGEACACALAKGPGAAAVDRAMKWLEAPNHHLVSLLDEAYPRALREVACPPCALYVQGRTDLLNAPAFGIVGSRNATIQGARDAEALAYRLSACGLTIVSGLALGIDAAAHRGGLRGAASSVAVLGTGADRIYPRANQDLAHALASTGTIVSEFPLGMPPLPGNFPRRNRLISGLARGVLVVEAALESGSLITARFAAEQGRDVFAIPGSIHSPLSKGCHQLIKDGAKLVEAAEDILSELRWDAGEPTSVWPPFAISDPLLDAMGRAPISIDEIVDRTGEGVSAIAAGLARLQLAGAVAPLPGGLFQRLEQH